MKTIIASFALLLLVGCQGYGNLAKTLPSETLANGNLGSISTDLTLAHSNLSGASRELLKITPDVPTVKKLVVDADGQIVDASGKVPTLSKNISDISKDRDTKAAYITAHANDWLGPRAHKYLFWGSIILGIGALCLVLAPEIETPALAGFAVMIGHLFTGGVVVYSRLLGKLFAWIVNKVTPAVKSLTAKTVNGLAAVAPATPTP